MYSQVKCYQLRESLTPNQAFIIVILILRRKKCDRNITAFLIIYLCNGPFRHIFRLEVCTVKAKALRDLFLLFGLAYLQLA